VSWVLQIGVNRGPIEVYDGATVRACVTAALMAAEVDDETAEGKGREAWQAVKESREVWTTYLPDGRNLNVWDSSPEPQYDKQCDGLDGFGGNRCGRYLNHPGEC